MTEDKWMLELLEGLGLLLLVAVAAYAVWIWTLKFME